MTYFGSPPRLPQQPAVPARQPQPSKPLPAISLRGVRFRYPNASLAVTAPTLDLFPSDMIYLGGPSGSGKSTLMKLLAIEMLPDDGDIWMFGRHLRSLASHDLDDLRGGGLTYIPQGNLGLIDQSPVRNIARILQDFDGLSGVEADQRAKQALWSAGLAQPLLEKRVSVLSGGEQARVAVAKVFATERPVCLMDEILPALDDKSRKDVLALLQRLADFGFLVVVIAHQPELQPYFGRVITMSQGQIISDTRNARRTSVNP